MTLQDYKEEMKKLIQMKSLPVNRPIPSVAEYASKRALNPTLVQRMYESLQKEGYLRRKEDGWYVNTLDLEGIEESIEEGIKEGMEARKEAYRKEACLLAGRMKALGFGRDQILEIMTTWDDKGEKL